MIHVGIVEDNKTIRESLNHFVQTDPECRCVFSCSTARRSALSEISKHKLDVHSDGYSVARNCPALNARPRIKKSLPRGANHHGDRL